ncbi:uncharacterized protein LOC126902121 [Daktulosphaira vitifoliae]|uniref:uncharacterized protein LOC126902121 n=1 Tax=Daktulosphaira vitifoliae TaxID=58002 RepID=UPI0021AA7682|nr:uncharacterized protein LOC126902121 [Daktulosphaira vitifoliae]
MDDKTIHDNATLIKRRGVLKGQLTRFLNNVLAVKSDGGDKNNLKTRREKIEETWVNFQKVQEEIEGLEETDDTEDEYRIQFEEIYFEAVTEYDKIMNEMNHSNDVDQISPTNIMTSTRTINNTSNQPSIVNLAPLNVPTFSGCYKEWSTFNDIFIALIHENEALSDVQRFFYLKNSLAGDALKVIQLQQHTKAIYDLQSIDEESSRSLRQFIDELMGNMKALENLGHDTNKWGQLLIHVILTKLDEKTLRAWEKQASKNKVSKVEELIDFLNNHFQMLEAVESATKVNGVSENKFKDKKRNNYEQQKKTVFHSTQKKFKCYMCNETSHAIYHCKKFLELNIKDRRSKINQLNICEVCLSQQSESHACKFSGCRKCGEKHNTLLHLSEEIDNENLISTHITCINQKHVLLSTAIIIIQGKSKEKFVVRALLDSGSQTNFITTDLAQKLKLQKKRVNIGIAGVDNSMSKSYYSLKTTIQSRDNNYSNELEFLSLPKITSLLPTEKININNVKIPAGIMLADPHYYVPKEIDVLLGAECFYTILMAGKHTQNDNEIIFQETRLGWIVAGIATSSCNKTTNTFFNSVVIENKVNLNELMSKFWKLEEINSENQYSSEERACVEHFERTVKRDHTGKFIVKLPLKNDIEQLGESKSMAMRRFLSIENKLRNNLNLRESYVEFMNEYAQLNHMEESEIEHQKSYYMPHHAVVRDQSATTQTRVVFDASAASSTGVSLNQLLMKGPVIQDELVNILARFRVHKYVLSADIAKMYRQIWVDKDDRRFQKILWRSQPNEHLKEYCLSTVTYGTTSAPYLATACLKKLAEENSKKYPLASQAIISDFYVDDYLGGANTIEEAENLRDQIITITNSAGFPLRKWISNEPSLLSSISNINNDPHCVLNMDGSAIKTLGLLWSPRDDLYQYKFNNQSSVQAISKRTVLSTIATIFDPLGLIGPVVVTAKKIMQQLWQSKLDWDDEIPSDISRQWKAYRDELPCIEKIKIPRRIIGCENVCDLQIHAFADASTSAYGSCIYLRATDVNDSTIVLAWINSPSSKWKTFVAHRVGEIHDTTSANQWRHISSPDNPADIISRGCNANSLVNNQLWWKGPKWLSHEEANWPNYKSNYNLNNCDLEEKKIIVTLSKIENFDLTDRYSSFNKLLRVTKYILKWKKIIQNKQSSITKNNCSTYAGPDEINEAKIKLLQMEQNKYFSEEFKCLKRGEHVKKNSKLFFLSPFIDKNGLIRVGGRLNNLNMNLEKKNPILLPAKSALTRLIFSHEHMAQLHVGPQALLAAVRETYWPINGRNLARLTVHKCVSCFRSKPNPRELTLTGCHNIISRLKDMLTVSSKLLT